MFKFSILILLISGVVFSQTSFYDEVNEENLSDAEANIADNYIHAGLVEEVGQSNAENYQHPVADQQAELLVELEHLARRPPASSDAGAPRLLADLRDQ